MCRRCARRFSSPSATHAALQAAVRQYRERLDACRQAVNSIYAHLEENGISVGMVFRLRQLRARMLRDRELLDALLSPKPAMAALKLLARRVATAQESKSIGALISTNSILLSAKMAERSAETGEHYITRNRADYKEMLGKAMGGGAVTALTTLLKFMVVGIGLSAFWSGFWASVAYAGSFILIQLLHFTLATKQPAMTAPAMAAKLKDIDSDDSVTTLEDFVDEVTHLVRSQVAAVFGNVFMVVPAVLLVNAVIALALGRPMISHDSARHVLESLTLLGPTLLWAAFTGVVLFASSMIAGWVENWFVLHHLGSAMRHNPRFTAVLGNERAARWSAFTREHISGFASNISLGFMLGLIPAFTGFFGLELELRHVTLSTGQLAAAGRFAGAGGVAAGGILVGRGLDSADRRAQSGREFLLCLPAGAAGAQRQQARPRPHPGGYSGALAQPSAGIFSSLVKMNAFVLVLQKDSAKSCKFTKHHCFPWQAPVC